ncbi:MAG: hypothetical protein QXY45_02575 [Candidatus Aenigmatarchaeota archaeon]
MVTFKIIGWCCIIFGALMMIAFPSATANQPESMGKAGIIIGFFFIGLGLLLLKL